MAKIMAMTVDGNLSYCSVAPEERGKGRCNHVTHQGENETVEVFVERVNELKKDNPIYGKVYKEKTIDGDMSLKQYKMSDVEKAGLLNIMGRKQLEEDIEGGYIELNEPLWNDMDKSSFSEKSGIPIRDINALLRGTKFVITDVETPSRGVEKGKIITEIRKNSLGEKHGDEISFDTGVKALNNIAKGYDFEATKDIYVLPYYMRQDPPDGAKNPINTLYNYLIVKRKDPDVQQGAYDSLLNNSKAAKPITQRGGYAIDSLAEKFKGKKGIMRSLMSGRNITYSGRAVITPDIEMQYGEAGIPASMAANILKPSISDAMMQEGKSEEEIKEFLESFHGIDQEDVDPASREELDRIVSGLGRKVALDRQPSLHGSSLLCFSPRISPDCTIKINPLNLPGYNGDIDGDTMTAFAINDAYMSQLAEKEFGAESSVGTHLPRYKEEKIIKPAKEALWGLLNILSKRS